MKKEDRQFFIGLMADQKRDLVDLMVNQKDYLVDLMADQKNYLVDLISVSENRLAKKIDRNALEIHQLGFQFEQFQDFMRTVAENTNGLFDRMERVEQWVGIKD